MKKTLLILALSMALLLSACAATEPEIPPPDPEAGTEANTPTPASNGGLSIDYKMIAYPTSFDWESTEYENGLYGFLIPGDWTVIDGDAHGLINGAFFVPPETDLDDFRFGNHIAVEFYGEPYYTEDQRQSTTPEALHTDFFAMRSIEFSKMSALTKLEFSLWNCEGTDVYVAEYQRSNDTLTMDTTAYYVMHPDCYLIVYATTFGSRTAIPVTEAAQQLIATFAPL